MSGLGNGVAICAVYAHGPGPYHARVHSTCGKVGSVAFAVRRRAGGHTFLAIRETDSGRRLEHQQIRLFCPAVAVPHLNEANVFIVFIYIMYIEVDACARDRRTPDIFTELGEWLRR